ncbi:MAG: DUF1998 domain-containing protein, partial [Gemmataceae bacterium]|nr:DUF1998 domain-containing protein [Gemmataceae bacterium]
LAATSVSLGKSVERVLDLGEPDFPVYAELRASLELTPAKRAEVIAAFREIAAADAAITGASWFDDAWLVETVEQAPTAFDRAFDRWRELYRAALQQRSDARLTIDKPRTPKRDRERAERLEREAKRDIALLLNDGDVTETDFYPYRYLATEGFLPGYNFPRLPLRVLLNVRDESRSIDRPRFLGLAEFGPWNVIYHEGRKYRVTSQILPAGRLDARITSAQLCKECGYIHPAGDVPVNVCDGCGVAFDAETRDFPQGLLDQSTARARPYDRISSDEEDRSREGYAVTTHFQFAPGVAPRRASARGPMSDGADGEADLLTVEFAPRARVWRINHGWKRSGRQQGFTIDPDSGWWAKKEQDEVEGPDPDDPGGTPSRGNIKPYVTDNRNVLLLRPETPLAGDEAFLKTLAYALQRGIQVVYQVEEREVEVELIGREANQRLMLWEAAEGGTGVWDRMMDDPASFAQVAKEALRICHFDERGEPDPAWTSRCGRACYDCLLSYGNQREHWLLDRHLIREYLAALAASTMPPATATRPYDEQFAWLAERIDPASSLEREFLAFLRENRLRLPDAAQTRPVAEIPVQPDFFYERDGRPGVCIFVDGPHHEAAEQAARDRETREALADRGFRVVAIQAGVSFGEQLARYGDVFGSIGQDKRG